jgi:uncharacterized protein involved in outer membrane biogenesis
MRITFRLLLWLVFVAFTLPLALLFTLLFVDLNAHRAHIERTLSAAFGREVVLEGPIVLEASLTPRLTVEGLKISNPAWASRPFLATIDKFKIQAGLLPLLDGELEIQALEFHGVNLQLEDGPDDSNNYTFGSSERPSLLPAIEHLLLYDVELSWLPLGGIAKTHHLQQVRARKVPGQPVELDLTGTLFEMPMQLGLRGQPRGKSWPFGPWDSTVQGNIGDISVRLSGSIPQPTEWYRGTYQFEVQADSIRQINLLKDPALTELGAFMLGGVIRFNLNEYLVISDLRGSGVDGEVSGNIRWELAELWASPGSWQQLLASAEFDLRANSEASLWQRELTVGNQATRLTVSEIEVSAAPQSPLVMNARATLDDSKLAVKLQAEPLANLLVKSESPWEVLALDVSGEGLQLLASGSVSRPLTAPEFDISYTLEGPRFAQMLGLSGDFKLTGRYQNQSDRHLFEELSARIADLEIDGRIALHLAADQPLPRLAGSADLDVAALMRHVELDMAASIPEGLVDEPIRLAGRTLAARDSSVQIRALPGEPVRLNTSASLNGAPIQLRLRGETLAALAERATGPWRDLLFSGEGQGFKFSVHGDVARPFEAEGLDVAFELEGTEIDALLPLVDLALPPGGAHSLSGRFKHTPEGMLFDELQIRLGRSDFSGRVLLRQGKERPRVEADLSSELLYLSEFLKEGEVATNADTDTVEKVIPDFELPIKRMREIDGELRFTAKSLVTSMGQFEDLGFTLSLEDEKLRLENFQVHGVAGDHIEAAARIDASQNPPSINLRLSLRELDYGAILKQAGLAESVEGTLNVTLRLTGEGGNRYELLSTANGQLIVVGKQGRFGSRRLDLWGSDLVTTMLSPQWHREDITELNCVVADIDIATGVASTDKLLIDTGRITLGATGTLNLKTEELNLVVAPHPKRASLVSLTSPAHVTGTLSALEVSTTALPRRRKVLAGGGMLAGLLNPAYLVFTFSQIGTRDANPCVAAIEKAKAMKGENRP